MSIAYLNGQFLPLEQACIPALDRGFIFADGVYEVIPVYATHLFRLQAHLRRLQNSLDGIKLSNPLSETEWTTTLEQLLQHNPSHGDQAVYLQVTRGPAPRAHNFPKQIRPTVFMMVDEMPAVPPSSGVAAISLTDLRWQLCQIKSVALLAGVLAREQAVSQGAVEAILLRDNYVTEGAASNVFIVKDEIVYTPPEGNFILSGITRDLVLEALRAAQIDCRECQITVEQLRCADEIWLTSSTREILPVIQLDGASVGTGKPGAMWQRTWDLFQNYKQAVRNQQIT
jgi:D-alanine transaminase